MVISAQDFINKSVRVISISPFVEGDEPIQIKVKSTGVMSMMSQGRIPNSLLATVDELFSDKKKFDKSKIVDLEGNVTEDAKEKVLEKLERDNESFKSMIELMETVAKEAMVEPTYEEIGEYMTDSQLMDVFQNALSGVEDLNSFR